MKCTTILAVGATIISLAEGAPRVVSIQTQRKTVTDPLKRDQLRRRGTVKATLENAETLYFINASIGTPAQPLRLHIDTGSSDLWVNTDSSSFCSQSQKPCAASGTYGANHSSTYEYVGSWFNISYVDGSGASGDYVTDVLTVGGTTLDDFQFGIGYESTSGQGILGIGYEVNEVQVGRAQLSPYENLPAKMVSAGAINSNAYSLWLNDLDANTGSILFGGVDTDQFEGELATLPVQAEGAMYAEFLITLTSLHMDDTVVASGEALPVLLDSGSSLTYLPDAMVQTIYNQVSAQYDSSDGAAYVACSLASDDTVFKFNFSEPVISVAMNELVLDVVTSSGKRPTFSDGTDACLFGIAPAGTSTNVLGDTFLRSAYVVYDLGNNEISLAQTKFNTTTSHIVEIGTGSKAVPSATSVSNAVSATGIGEATSTTGGFGLKSGAPPRLQGVGMTSIGFSDEG
ncbi:aspartic proteinase precursor [Cryphonectria parasitica EP155]|uniref:Probable aspartic-type endopeptidase OPSB n=1 Tax=Cryphonectria parasitica (strain ATCC 38755 / EP155) TaxID=660469 RepID=A0A9P5CV72_CRYP1|nr:aspartic proteinase precursor [Cryphonectria parasitica EP155]KAF3770555.1 aspartic proteinase precursor [Cryphonectria parasitica EP155]